MRLIILLVVIMGLFSLPGNGQQLIFVFLNSKKDKAELPTAEVDKIMEGHMANIKRLADEGKLISAGPFEGGGGIFIFKAVSVAQAKEWLETDPGVKAKRWDIELFPYTARVGNACSLKEPFEMVMYDFVRYTLKKPTGPGWDASATSRQHSDYLKPLVSSGNVVAEGSFGDEGGILVMRGEFPKDVIAADPVVTSGFYWTEYKKLYIAKGAFCEH